MKTIAMTSNQCKRLSLLSELANYGSSWYRARSIYDNGKKFFEVDITDQIVATIDSDTARVVKYGSSDSEKKEELFGCIVDNKIKFMWDKIASNRQDERATKLGMLEDVGCERLIPKKNHYLLRLTDRDNDYQGSVVINHKTGKLIRYHNYSGLAIEDNLEFNYGLMVNGFICNLLADKACKVCESVFCECDNCMCTGIGECEDGRTGIDDNDNEVKSNV